MNHGAQPSDEQAGARRPARPHRPRRARLFGAVAGGLALVAALAACGSSGSSAKSSASGSGSASASASAAATGGAGGTGGTRTVQTAEGPVQVPADAKRIVAIQPSALATLLDVGETVVGTYDEGEQYVSPRYLTAYKAAAKVGDNGEINVEKVAELHPDLIIGLDYEWNTSVYSKLKEIAPTVIAPVDSWSQTAQAVAAAVGRTDQLNALAAKVQTRSEQIKSTYAGVLSRYHWDILQGGFDKGQFWLYGPGSDAGRILAGAGVQFASGSAGVSGPANKTISYEKLDTLSSADVIGFYAGYDDKPNNEGPALFAQPGFKRLKADTSDRLVAFPDFLPGGYGDALALLDELEAGLKKLQS